MKPTLKVMKIDEFGKTAWYRVACECGTGEHDATIEVEYDEEWNRVFVNFYTEVEYPWWREFGISEWFRERWRRIKAVFKLLFLGYLEAEGHLMLKDEEHIQNFIDALHDGMDLVREKNRGMN